MELACSLCGFSLGTSGSSESKDMFKLILDASIVSVCWPCGELVRCPGWNPPLTTGINSR